MGRAPRKFLIVGAPRTGSTMLDSILNAHPDVLSVSELLNDEQIAAGEPIFWPLNNRHHERVVGDAELLTLRQRDPIAFLERIYRFVSEDDLEVFGFKMLYLHGQRNPTIVEYLASLSDLHVIHLRRRNRLRRYVSEVRAMRFGLWNLGRDQSKPVTPPALELTAEECVANFEAIANLEDDVDRMFARQPSLRLSYEDLAADHSGCGRRVQEFLGLSPRELEPWTVKLATAPLREQISNLDELQRELAATPWTEYFES